MEKWIAGFLQVSSAALFLAVGAAGEDAILLLAPAIASGVSGLLLWARASGRQSDPPPSLPEPRSASALPPSRVEELLLSLQEDVAQLRDEQRFHQELYSGQRPRDPLR